MDNDESASSLEEFSMDVSDLSGTSDWGDSSTSEEEAFG